MGAELGHYLTIRSFKHKSSQRRSEDSERAEGREERREGEEESGVLESLDSRAVATILRGLADAAENWDEL